MNILGRQLNIFNCYFNLKNMNKELITRVVTLFHCFFSFILLVYLFLKWFDINE